VASAFRTCGMTPILSGSWESRFPSCGVGLVRFSETPTSPFTMGKAWVLPSFKNILIDTCQEFLQSTDKSKEKTRSSLITRVAGEVCQVIEGTTDTLPEDLEKVGFNPTDINYTDGGYRLSERGFKTRPADMLMETLRGSLKRIHVATRSRRRPGMGDLYAETFMLIELQRCI